MRKFTFKLSIFIIPLLIPICLYIYIDPFKLFGNYSNPINTNNNYQLPFNRDVQSTNLFLLNYKKQNYNSFILGNSRSQFYQVNTWKKYINGNCFHFNASGESLFGINRKLKLINDLNVDIKNVIIVMDASVLCQTTNNNGHLFIKHPFQSKESQFTFHIEMFKGFFPMPMFAYIDLFYSGIRKPYMSNYGVDINMWKHDTITNQLNLFVCDSEIVVNNKNYYKHQFFHKRENVKKYAFQTIHSEQQEILNEIIYILKKHNSTYKIIINPLYDQLKLDPHDLEYLKKVFGIKNVFDFSGINSITNNYHNYYEESHYRPIICDSILSIVYN